MASIEGISFDYDSLQFSRTILSSVGGFSQPAQRGIHSLQGLLHSVRKLNLNTFEGSSFTFGTRAVGEGVSYKVWRCEHRPKGAVYAVKQIKLPSADDDMKGFQRQIGCILRDLEVMAGLARHPNVLNLVGYGWDHKAGGVLPFLVVEFAPGGTLRKFLQEHKISADEKVILCQDVARGLHALHVSGICHGDLKLDNVLAAAIPDNLTVSAESEIPDIHARRFGVVARLSDFGHSLRIVYNEEPPEYLERYGGTLVYNAPEVQKSRHSSDPSINFRKCDVWALGLLCWEVFRDGNPYYHSDEVYQRIDSARGTSSASSTNSSRTLLSATDVEELIGTCSEFAALATSETRAAINTRLDPSKVTKLDNVYRRTLVVDPEKRVADIPFIPLFSQLSTTQRSPETDTTAGSSWTFDIFRAARFLPHYVKQQVLSDCMQLGAEPGTSDVAARAAFQAGMALLVGFGARRDKLEADKWFKTSATKGLIVAGSFQPLFDDTTSMMHTYLSCVRNGFRKVLASENPSDHVSPWTFSEDMYKRFDLSQRGITRVTDNRGNSALMYACKLGDSQGAQHLLDLSGKDPDLERHDASGTNFLHWLFMFPDSDIRDMASRLIKNANVPTLIVTRENDDGLIPLIDNPTRVQVDHVVTNPQRLDPQLPIRLQGTPLAFATATNCMRAIRALLAYHADPLAGIVPWRENMLNESAIHVAVKLHVANVLQLLLDTIASPRFNLAPSDWIPLMWGLVQCLPTAYPLERILIHGDDYRKAARKTVHVLMRHMRLHEVPINLWSFLKPAIDFADIDLAETIANLTSFDDLPLELSTSELGHLIVCCTTVACSAAFDDARSIDLMKFAIRLGSKIDGDPATELRPINIAIDYHNTLVLEWLISQGADVNIRDSRGRTPVHVLFESDFSSSFGLSQLIDAGANCIAITNDGLTPLDIAMQKGKCEDVVALLTSRCRDFVLQTTNYQSIFLKAITLQNPEMASKVIELASADGQLESIDLSLALCDAITLRNSELAEYLLSLGADPQADIVAPDGFYRPIWLAAETHQSEFIKLALSHKKLDVKAPGPAGHSLLTFTIASAANEPSDRSAAEAIDLLLDAEADPDTPNALAMYPLQIAIEYLPPVGQSYALLERLWFVKRLLKAGASHNVPLAYSYHFPKEQCRVVNEGGQELWYAPATYQNMTPLHYAIIRDDEDLVNLLLENDASTATRCNDGRAALHIVAAPAQYHLLGGSVYNRFSGAIAQALLAKGADVLGTDDEGKTALDLAVANNNYDVVRAILVHLRDKSGFSRRAFATRTRVCLTYLWIASEFCAFPTNFLRFFCAFWLLNTFHRISQRYERIKWMSKSDDFFATRREKNEALWRHPFAGLISKNLNTLLQVDGAWEDSIKLGHWGCVCACIEADLYGMTSDLDIYAALPTLRYALETENGAVLTKFMGSSPSSQHPAYGPPEPAFLEYWKEIQATLTTFTSNTLDRMRAISEAGGYFPVTPVNFVENLKLDGYVEAQQESGMTQVALSNGMWQQPQQSAYYQGGYATASYGASAPLPPQELDAISLPQQHAAQLSVNPPLALYYPDPQQYVPPASPYNPPTASYHPSNPSLNVPGLLLPESQYNPPDGDSYSPAPQYVPSAAPYDPPTYNLPPASYYLSGSPYGPPEAQHKPPGIESSSPAAGYIAPQYYTPALQQNPSAAQYSLPAGTQYGAIPQQYIPPQPTQRIPPQYPQYSTPYAPQYSAPPFHALTPSSAYQQPYFTLQPPYGYPTDPAPQNPYSAPINPYPVTYSSDSQPVPSGPSMQPYRSLNSSFSSGRYPLPAIQEQESSEPGSLYPQPISRPINPLQDPEKSGVGLRQRRPYG